MAFRSGTKTAWPIPIGPSIMAVWAGVGVFPGPRLARRAGCALGLRVTGRSRPLRCASETPAGLATDLLDPAGGCCSVALGCFRYARAELGCSSRPSCRACASPPPMGASGHQILCRVMHSIRRGRGLVLARPRASDRERGGSVDAASTALTARLRACPGDRLHDVLDQLWAVARQPDLVAVLGAAQAQFAAVAPSPTNGR